MAPSLYNYNDSGFIIPFWRTLGLFTTIRTPTRRLQYCQSNCFTFVPETVHSIEAVNLNTMIGAFFRVLGNYHHWQPSKSWNNCPYMNSFWR